MRIIFQMRWSCKPRPCLLLWQDSAFLLGRILVFLSARLHCKRPDTRLGSTNGIHSCISPGATNYGGTITQKRGENSKSQSNVNPNSFVILLAAPHFTVRSVPVR